MSSPIQLNALTTSQGQSITIMLENLTVSDPDNVYPDDFILNIQPGDHYSHSNSTVTPDSDFIGALSVNITIEDGLDTSDVYSLKVTVNEKNAIPDITGQVELVTKEETELTIQLSDIVVMDSDNLFPEDFVLTVHDGDGYARVENKITPAKDFVGMLAIPVSVNDGNDESELFNLAVQVTAENDAPVIIGQRDLSTNMDTSLDIMLDDLQVEDPDNTYPDDFMLFIIESEDYESEGLTIQPKSGFVGSIIVKVKVNDGLVDSVPFDLSVAVVNEDDTNSGNGSGEGQTGGCFIGTLFSF